MITAIIGLVLGITAIVLGNALEGGHLEALLQPTAALIVFGGTLGATMLATSVSRFSKAIRGLGQAFLSKEPDYESTIKKLVEIASKARKEGILSLEPEIKKIDNPFLAANLRHIIDGYDPHVLEAMMDEAITHIEEDKIGTAKVWEMAGGYSPTIGILGAVLGLIHVMSNLSDSTKLGAGIAVAFVATIYGVGGANLILIPIGNRLKYLASKEILEYEIVKVGLIGIQTGLNPRIIQARLYNIIKEGKSGLEETENIKKAA